MSPYGTKQCARHKRYQVYYRGKTKENYEKQKQGKKIEKTKNAVLPPLRMLSTLLQYADVRQQLCYSLLAWVGGLMSGSVLVNPVRCVKLISLLVTGVAAHQHLVVIMIYRRFKIPL